MKPVKGKYDLSSVDVDAVVERMYGVVGRPLGVSFAMALGVSESAIKNWRARGEVASLFLNRFALENNVSIDWLLHGDQPAASGKVVRESQEKFSYDERGLLDKYRQCSEADRQIVRATVSALAAKTAAAPPVRKPVSFGVKPKTGPVKFKAGVKKRPKPESLAGAEKKNKKGN